MFYDFNAKLCYSRGIRESTDLETLKSMIPGCLSVEKTSVEQDKQGIDYIATLRKGAKILIDAKTRTKNCAKYWKCGPELALEIWSVKPENGLNGKTGWTLNESCLVDYILFTFDPVDCNTAFLYPFQLLRTSFVLFYKQWKNEFKSDIQSSGLWKSECLFVPEDVVYAAMRSAMQTKNIIPVTKQEKYYESLFDAI